MFFIKGDLFAFLRINRCAYNYLKHIDMNNVTYPSTIPTEPDLTVPITNTAIGDKESESSKAKRVKLKKLQKKLILGLIFLTAITTYLAILSYTQTHQIEILESKEKQLEQYKNIFKNKPFRIRNTSDSPFVLEQFEAVVLMESEKKDSFYLKTFDKKINETIKSYGTYAWEGIWEEDVNIVPGHALCVSMVFSRNNRAKSTTDILVLKDDKETGHTPNFNKLLVDK